LPDWIQPQLTQLVKEAPDADQWLNEIKYDGYRMHARLDRGEVRLLTRNGLNWTAKYPQIAAGELVGDADPALRLSGQHHAAIRGDPAAIEGGADLLALYGW
jgi:ATP-dependent DNA ligase